MWIGLEGVWIGGCYVWFGWGWLVENVVDCIVLLDNICIGVWGECIKCSCGCVVCLNVVMIVSVCFVSGFDGFGY